MQALPFSQQGKAASPSAVTAIHSTACIQLNDQKCVDSSQFTDTGTLVSTNFSWEFHSIPCAYMQCTSTLAMKRSMEFSFLRASNKQKNLTHSSCLSFDNFISFSDFCISSLLICTILFLVDTTLMCISSKSYEKTRSILSFHTAAHFPQHQK